MIKNNNTVYTAYIPDKYALLNNKIRLKFGDVWEDGWIIFKIGKKVSEHNLPDSHKQIKEHEKKREIVNQNS